jgi:hypothetical protein
VINEALKMNSCLNFTYERPTGDVFQFLDVSLRIEPTSGAISTGIYVKKTDKGLYFDFCSYVPMSYKLALIKTLIYRAFRLCSSWSSFHKEVQRITQNLINNNFPQSVIEKNILSLTNKLYLKYECLGDFDTIEYFIVDHLI